MSNPITAENPPWGLASYLGVAAAVVQYVTAVVLLLVSGPVEASITAFVTASVALVGVLTGRYSQANSQIKAAAQPATPMKLDTYPSGVTVRVGEKVISETPSSGAQTTGEWKLGDPVVTGELDEDDTLPGDDLPPELSENVPTNLTPRESGLEISDDVGDQDSASADGANEEVEGGAS